MDLRNKLAALLGGQPSLGSGMAEQAAQVLRSRPYQLHVQEMEAQGLKPLSPEEFMKVMRQQTQPTGG